MLHLGDITKINGYTAPIVDVVVGGSPCQDLSVAGKRAGLDGERSGLFMEQIRIVKEMRKADADRRVRSNEPIRPRYMVWENVPGAFSSNKAEDFRIVLEETAKVADENAVIPQPPKGKWTTSGCIMGDGWSIAWRVQDAQFWGVPQRRRRIALVADFGGQSAPEILFVRKSVSGHTEPSQPQGEETPTDATRSLGASDIIHSAGFCPEEGAKAHGIGYEDEKSPSLRTTNIPGVAYCIGQKGKETPSNDREPMGRDIYNLTLTGDKTCSLTAGGYTSTGTCPKVITVDQGGGKSACNVQEGQAPTLTCTHGGEPAVCYSVENHPADSRVDIDESGKVQTLTSRTGTGGGNVPMVMQESQVYGWHNQDSRITGPIDVGCTISTNAGGREGHLVITPIQNQCFSKSKRAQSSTDDETWKKSDVANTLNAFDVGDKRTTECVVTLDRASFNQGKNAKYDFEISDKGVNSPLVAKGPSAVAVHHIVRRLTPLECERLQGYPDGWTDIGEWTDSKGKVHKTSDAARYKALGNSIALPPWKWVMKRISACYERDATLASLFDGIGGFPLIWEQINGKDSCLWASEIDEFPIAVTKKRIGE